MSRITAAQIATALQSMQFQFFRDDDSFVIPLPTPAGCCVTDLFVVADGSAILVHAGALLDVPQERRSVIAQAAAHFNFSVLFGAFGLNAATGELAFDLPLHGLALGNLAETLKSALCRTAVTLAIKMPLLQRLCWGEESLEQVLGLPAESRFRSILRALDSDEAAES